MSKIRPLWGSQHSLPWREFPLLSDESKKELAWLERTLSQGRIPSRKPKVAYDPRNWRDEDQYLLRSRDSKAAKKAKFRAKDFALSGIDDLLKRELTTTYNMWAFVHKDFAKALANAMNDAFGDQPEYLELFAGTGWLAKALKDAGLIGKYHAVDWRVEDTVFPIEKLRVDEAVKKYRQTTTAYIISWMPAEPGLRGMVELIPKDAPIIYLGEWGGCCGIPAFFDAMEIVNFDSWPNNLWKKAQAKYFSWPCINDNLYLLKKIK